MMMEEDMGRPDPAHQQEHCQRLSKALAERQWIGFDLDDTLHEFRRAASAAAGRVLAALHEAYGVPLATLESHYAEVLRAGTRAGFAEGKSSSEYRRARFLAVADRLALPLAGDGALVSRLLRLYEDALEAALAPKRGARDLLRTARRLGKRMAVVTEGPQGAQAWTLERLGLAPHVDFLATAGRFRVSKVDGLFARVLETLGIAPAEMAYVGDSEARDMVPAMAEGIFCVYFAEGAECDLAAHPPRVDTLTRLESILSSGGQQDGVL
ncbi:HAD-superfamily hydrolase, subfamily IA, variant 1 [Xylaria palmicola]|nr:HAD-superfamily hydrolase, subfamily IA, variant 1 [Xylaria palmicola]